jgi:hypothetical protein
MPARLVVPHNITIIALPSKGSELNPVTSADPRIVRTNHHTASTAPDCLFLGCLEILNVEHFAHCPRLGEARQQGVLLGHRHVLAHSSPDWLRFGAGIITPSISRRV